MHELDFERDGQVCRFEKKQIKGGRDYLVYWTECAVCRKPVRFATPCWKLAMTRRCKEHKMVGVPVGSTTEARRIRSQGWEVADGSAVAKLWAAGEVRNAGRPRSDPRPAKPAKKEPSPRKTKQAGRTKREMAAARAEKVVRRKARLAEKGAR